DLLGRDVDGGPVRDVVVVDDLGALRGQRAAAGDGDLLALLVHLAADADVVDGQPAGRAVVRAAGDVPQRRDVGDALVHDVGATRVERAAAGQPDQRRRLALDGLEPPSLALGAG